MRTGNQYCNQRAVQSKENWLEAKKRNPYNGPILFLMTQYVTRFEDLNGKFDILWPTIRGLKNSRLLNRQKAEIKRGGFGRGLRIVRYDGSPKISKRAMNEGGKDAKVSTSKQHSTDAEVPLQKFN